MTDDDLDIDLAVDLTRSVPFTIERADTDSDGFTFEGYAAVFDTPTTIDSWEGTFDEQIARGAFRKTLRERPRPSCSITAPTRSSARCGSGSSRPPAKTPSACVSRPDSPTTG